MSFDWTGYLRLAETIAATPVPGCDPEASKRTAISRAYYGVVITARNSLLSRGGPPFSTAGTMHREVADRLQNASVPSERQLGFTINAMRRIRNRADYDDTMQADVELQSQLTHLRNVEPALAAL